jgi:hypothetical protein
MNEHRNDLFITGLSDRVDILFTPTLTRILDQVYDLRLNASGGKTIMHTFLTKSFDAGSEVLKELVSQYHTHGVTFYLRTHYCGCYWMSNDSEPFACSPLFKEVYTAIPNCVTSLFGAGQGVIERDRNITFHRNRNRTIYHADTVTEVLFLDWSSGALATEVVQETELFARFYGDGGDDLYLDPAIGRA